MTEPSRPPARLSDQANSPLERALLNAGRSVHVSDATRAGVFEALGLEAHPSTIAAIAQPKSRIFTFRRGAFLLAAMVVSAAAFAVPIVRRSFTQPLTVLPVESTTQPDPVAREGQPGNGNAELEASPVLSPTTQPEEIEERRPSRASDEATPVRPVSPQSSRNALAAELAALDAVRAKLNAGEPRAAQQLLDAYQREFPKPRLALEAEVLRIHALDRAGQSEAARKRAQAFVQAHPKGVLTGRVRRYLEK